MKTEAQIKLQSAAIVDIIKRATGAQSVVLEAMEVTDYYDQPTGDYRFSASLTVLIDFPEVSE